jgi:hypothetical protein
MVSNLHFDLARSFFHAFSSRSFPVALASRVSFDLARNQNLGLSSTFVTHSAQPVGIGTRFGHDSEAYYGILSLLTNFHPILMATTDAHGYFKDSHAPDF